MGWGEIESGGKESRGRVQKRKGGVEMGGWRWGERGPKLGYLF